MYNSRQMSKNRSHSMFANSLLYLENVSLGYDAPNIVTGINLSINAKERIALVGQNGVGKSSLLHAVMGMMPHVTGKIIFNGTNITNLATDAIAKLGIAIVKQEHAVFGELTVAEHFDVLIKKPHKIKKISHLEENLQYFPDLIDSASLRAKQLSGGQRQQLAIAMALATKPKLLLLDEPSANVQPSIVENMIHSLLQVTTNTDMSLLIAEQNLLVIKQLTESAYVIEQGKLMQKADLYIT